MQTKVIVNLFCKPLQCTNRVRYHLGHYPVQYLVKYWTGNEQFDWLILVIGPLAAQVMWIKAFVKIYILPLTPNSVMFGYDSTSL